MRALAKENGLYSEKRGGWITEQAQHARVRRSTRCTATRAPTSSTAAARWTPSCHHLHLRPGDRVGVIRKLRVNETLVKDPADGSWSVDLTKAMRSHKSAKHHGGTKHALPRLTWPLIDRLCQLIEFDELTSASKYYLLHNVRSRDALRPLTEGPFGSWVAELFAKYSGTRVVPKNLRSIFIVWLRDQPAPPTRSCRPAPPPCATTPTRRPRCRTTSRRTTGRSSWPTSLPRSTPLASAR